MAVEENVAPREVARVEVTQVQIVSPAGTIAGPALRVRPSQPQVFGTAGPSGYDAAALNQDGTVNSITNPASSGSIVTIWATGAGQFSNPSRTERLWKRARVPIHIFC